MLQLWQLRTRYWQGSTYSTASLALQSSKARKWAYYAQEDTSFMNIMRRKLKKLYSLAECSSKLVP